MLLTLRCRLGALNRNAVESLCEQFYIVGVGTADFDTQRNTTGISENRPLGTQLAAIGRVFAGFFPRPEAISSSLRPRFANSTECL